ncbi:hypothetical protein M434DRAFT_395813 [Hypoxylon sp. CO27-5]|nr:hypothetical protein M434DRAFT_395813 [Hypoxylon sp. CO27-5]
MQHSTIEVVPDTGMQVAPDPSVPEVVYPHYTEYKPWQELSQSSSVPQESRIAGLRRATFWLLVALFAVVALALGPIENAILTLHLGASVDSASASSTSTSVVAEPAAATTTASSSSSTPSSIAAQPTQTPTTIQDSGCPNISGNTVTKSSSKMTQTFRIYCDSDLTGSDQASLVVTTLDECITLCASLNWTQNRKDVGSVWNEKGVVGQTPGTCWCKGGSNIQVTAKSGIVVATPLPSSSS